MDGGGTQEGDWTRGQGDIGGFQVACSTVRMRNIFNSVFFLRAPRLIIARKPFALTASYSIFNTGLHVYEVSLLRPNAQPS